ncbi:DUF3048 domain-containing protein [Bacillus aerolatus]|uniref:DUF3048 domain-containing protein n=1 Tax=Bacillus aerolatus TaxID=2653354 RepID=A0A6I1FCQ7_9BACI|nr:DUF3048 domain-containing protein [Bacillus aerolatus]KAB7705260.1 DUF3048 domain-containing protein [Bacillus aerolatus]
MKKLTMLSLLTGAILMSGCWGDKEKNIQEDNGRKVSKENKEQSYAYPLTGKQTNERPAQRATAVVINNHPQARPQTGLTAADVVYEVLTEGNVTRFLAVYQSEQPEKVGPVRSARDYFIELAKGYDSLFVAHGYSPEARERLFSGEMDELNGIQYDGTIFKRDPSRKAPHNSYISFDAMYKKAEEKGYSTDNMPDRLSFLQPSEAVEGADQKAMSVQVNYSSQAAFQVEYKYNRDKKRYERFTGGKQEFDRETNEAVSAANVLIIEAEHRVMDGKGRLDIDLSSGGNAYLLQNGAVHIAEWSNVDGRILPFKEGAPMGFVQGKTWINIIPASKGLDKMVILENN